MNTLLPRFSLFIKELFAKEDGQDMVEYALVVALIGFSAITGMRFLSTGLNRAFSQISTVLTSNIT
jgi:pilus assembly protein Flp/PilA